MEDEYRSNEREMFNNTAPFSSKQALLMERPARIKSREKFHSPSKEIQI